MFDMERCAHCGRWVPKGTYICPFCGKSVSGWDEPKPLIERWIEEERRMGAMQGSNIGCLLNLVGLVVFMVFILLIMGAC